MKIKTIVHDEPGCFDERVNQMLEEGYILGERSLIIPNTTGKVAHYAQLVLPDQDLDLDQAPEPFDPFQALHKVQEFCHSIPVEKCNAGSCPLRYWCAELESGGDPTDWVLPAVEA